MLSDFERKVLRVIGNYSAGRRRTPSVDELCVKTGRSRGGIMTVLDVLPEQRALYLQMKEDEKLETMPVIEQDELESFHYLIRDSARDDYAITVSWWNPIKGELGSICSMWGAVKWIDQNGRRIKLVSDEDSQLLDLDKITDVKG